MDSAAKKQLKVEMSGKKVELLQDITTAEQDFQSAQKSRMDNEDAMLFEHHKQQTQKLLDAQQAERQALQLKCKEASDKQKQVCVLLL